MRVASLIFVLTAACGGSSGSDSADADTGNGFSAPVCVDPAQVTLADTPASGGDAACLSVGLRPGGGCPGELVSGICPPSVSRDEVASFVRESGGDFVVFVRSRVTANSHGDVQADSRTVRAIPEGVDFAIESALEDGTRIRVQGRFSGQSIAVEAFDHEDPF